MKMRLIAGALAAVLGIAVASEARAQSGSTISDLPIATVPYNGSEVTSIDQTNNGATYTYQTPVSAFIPTIQVNNYCTSAQIASNIATCAQNAINAAQALATGSYGGAIVHFPAKYSPYRLTGTLAVTSSFVTLKGDGKQATYIDCSGNITVDCLQLGTLGAGQIRDVSIKDLGVFQSSAATAGAGVHVMSTYRATVSNVDIENAYRGVDVERNNNSTLLRDVLITLNQTVGNADYGVYWHDKGDGTSRSDVLYLYNVVEAAKYQTGTVGLLLDGQVNTVVGDGLHLLKNQYGMRVINSANSASYVPAFSDLHDVEIEGASSVALSIEAGSEWKFVNADITNSYGATSQGAADTYVVQCLPDTGYSLTRGLMIANGRIGLSGQSGAFLNCRDAQLANIQFVSTGQASANTYPVISVGSSAQDVIVSNIVCEEYGGAAKASQCLKVASGAVRVQVGGVNPQGVNSTPWWSDPGNALNFQVPALGIGRFSPSADGGTAGLRVDQTAITNFKVYNGTSGSGAIASYDMATGTASSYEQNQLIDNNGAPFAKTSFGSAIKSWLGTLPYNAISYAYVASPASGGTTTISDQQDAAILNNASALSTYTINLPRCDGFHDGALATMSSVGGVTTLTVGATSGAVVSKPTSLPAGGGDQFRCVNGTGWFWIK